MKNLEEVMNQINVQEEEQVKQPFMVTDLESAAEAQRRITYFNDRMAEIDGITQSQLEPFLKKIERIKEWGEQAKEEYKEKTIHYSNLLEHYIRDEVTKQIASGKKPKKSINLPYGKIALKAQQPEFQRDEEMLFGYAKESGYTKVTEKTDWSTLKKDCKVHDGKLYDKNGIEVPGVVVVDRDDKFYIELEG